MQYILDTHIYLWWLNNDKKLSISSKNIISDPNNIIFVSVVSFWEIDIKLRAKRLPLKTSFSSLITNLQFKILDVSLDHILKLHKLPLYHKDPFDRMLISQALVENAQIITGDKKIWKYNVKVIKA